MPISPGSCAPSLQWAGSEGWGLAVLHLSVTGPPLQLYFTFRVVQTVGVNAAEASDTVKFPRFTFGCVPRRQEERKEGTIEDRREGRSAGQRPHLDRAEKKTEKDRKRAEKRDRCKNNSSFQGLLIEEGRGLVRKWEEPMSTMKMKLSLQHNSAKTASSKPFTLVFLLSSPSQGPAAALISASVHVRHAPRPLTSAPFSAALFHLRHARLWNIFSPGATGGIYAE